MIRHLESYTACTLIWVTGIVLVAWAAAMPFIVSHITKTEAERLSYSQIEIERQKALAEREKLKVAYPRAWAAITLAEVIESGDSSRRNDAQMLLMRLDWGEIEEEVKQLRQHLISQTNNFEPEQ